MGQSGVNFKTVLNCVTSQTHCLVKDPQLYISYVWVIAYFVKVTKIFITLKPGLVCANQW